MKTYNYIIVILFTVFPFGNSLWGQAPTDLQIDGSNTDSINENRLIGAVIGRLTTTDASPVDRHTYALVSGTGDTDNAAFSIDGDQLLTAVVFDFETQNSYSIRVRTTDTASNTYEEAFTISVNDIGVESATVTQSLWLLNTQASYTLSSAVTLDLNTGIAQLNAGFFTANDITGDTGNSLGTAIGDVNGDGYLDIYVANLGQNKLWINSGTGTFTPQDILGDQGDSFGVSIADVNGDGHLDIYVANVGAGTNGQNKLWINNGTGTFTAQDITGDEGNSYGASIADVNGDGHLDIYVGNQGGQQNKLWINDGTATFIAQDITGDTGDSRGASIGDVNGDGHLDIYVANSSGEQNKLWINSGTATPTFTAQNILGDTENSTKPSIADINGDGHLDIYVSNFNGAQNKLWINNGTGTFTAQDIPGDTGSSSGSSIGDVNGDGHLDIYVVNLQNRLWINSGTATPTFTAQDISGDTGSSFGTSIGDVNGDGHLDLYVANSNGEQNKLWLGGFSQSKPYISPTTAQSFMSSLTGFTEVLSANNQGSVSYQVSIDNGSTWQYWNGTAWTNTTQTDGTETTSANLIDTNIATLDTDGGDFLWRAYLDSNGSQRVELDQVNVSFDLTTTPHSIRMGSGQNQSIPVNSLYPVTLVALVEDANGNRLPGIAVTFTVPDSGPSLTFDSTGTNSSTRNTNSNGAAITSRMTPNSMVGSFLVTATVDGTSLATSTLFENLAMDLIPPMITNSSIVGGSQSITATQVLFQKDFDENANDITQDDFELITTGTASGTISNFSEGLAGIRSRATITVGNISGDGTISVRLKPSTDITDVPGNGNGTNGHATQAVSSTIHNVQFTPIETLFTLSSNVLSIEDIGGSSNDDLSLSVSGTLLRIEDTNNVLGGAGTFVTNHIRTFPLSSINRITINTQSGTDTVTLSGALSFSGNGGLNIRGNTAILQTASITLEYGTLSYRVSRSIRLPSGGGIIATGSSTIELLSTASITLNAPIRNTSTDPNNTIYLVSGWDSSTAFNPNPFNGFNSVSELTGTTPFGNNGASILLGDGSQTTSVTVGSRYGHTGLYGYSIVLTAGQGGSNRFAQLGYTTSDQGSSYTVSGTLTLRAKQALRLIGGGDTNPFNYAQVGQVGADTVSDTTVEATVTSSIDCAVGNEIYLSGGSPLSNYSQLGHGGYNALGIYIGVYILHTPEVSIKLNDNGGQGYSRLGND